MHQGVIENFDSQTKLVQNNRVNWQHSKDIGSFECVIEPRSIKPGPFTKSGTRKSAVFQWLFNLICVLTSFAIHIALTTSAILDLQARSRHGTELREEWPQKWNLPGPLKGISFLFSQLTLLRKWSIGLSYLCAKNEAEKKHKVPHACTF